MPEGSEVVETVSAEVVNVEPVVTAARKRAARQLAKRIDEFLPCVEALMELLKGIIHTANNIVNKLGS